MNNFVGAKYYYQLLINYKNKEYDSSNLYLSFADECIKRNKLDWAQNLIEKLSNSNSRQLKQSKAVNLRIADAYSLCKQYSKAIEKYQKIVLPNYKTALDRQQQILLNELNNEKEKEIKRLKKKIEQFSQLQQIKLEAIDNLEKLTLTSNKSSKIKTDNFKKEQEQEEEEEEDDAENLLKQLGLTATELLLEDSDDNGNTGGDGNTSDTENDENNIKALAKRIEIALAKSSENKLEHLRQFNETIENTLERFTNKLNKVEALKFEKDKYLFDYNNQDKIDRELLLFRNSKLRHRFKVSNYKIDELFNIVICTHLKLLDIYFIFYKNYSKVSYHMNIVESLLPPNFEDIFFQNVTKKRKYKHTLRNYKNAQSIVNNQNNRFTSDNDSSNLNLTPSMSSTDRFNSINDAEDEDEDEDGDENDDNNNTVLSDSDTENGAEGSNSDSLDSDDDESHSDEEENSDSDGDDDSSNDGDILNSNNRRRGKNVAPGVPAKKIKRNELLKSFFETGLFGLKFVPNSLLFLEILHRRIRALYFQCKNYYRNEKYLLFLQTIEQPLLMLCQICYDKAQKLVVMTNESGSLKYTRKYSMNHLGYVFRDECILELTVLLCKVWYFYNLERKKIQESIEKVKENDNENENENSDDNDCSDDDYDDDEEEERDIIDLDMQIQMKIMQEMIHNSINAIDSDFTKNKKFNLSWIAELYLILANIYYNHSNYEASYHTIVRVLEYCPNNINAMRYAQKILQTMRYKPKITRAIERSTIKSENKGITLIWHELLLGHSSFCRNSYEKAATIYSKLLQISEKNKMTKNNSCEQHSFLYIFLHLMLGITYLHHAMKRTTKYKNWIIFQSVSYFKKYMQLSINNVESLYNFARALHLIGQFGHAATIYHKIIDTVQRQDMQSGESNSTKYQSILQYAAYNLSMLYQSQGRYQLANQTLMQNVVV